MDGCFKGGTCVWATGIACSKYAVKVAGQNDVGSVVTEVVRKRSIEKVLQIVVSCTRIAIRRPSKLLST